MATATPVSNPAHALLDELMQVEGKAEIIGGRIVTLVPTGGLPGYAGDEIYAFLREYARRGDFGWAVGDNKGFLCDLPARKTFSPDAAFYTGPAPDMGFFPQPPVFAAEVRSKDDYSAKAERAIRAKIGDYFAAGTQVVWDVDLESDEVIAKYTAPDAVYPQIFRRGEVANAKPAVPGWTMNVDDLFPRVRR